MGREYTVSTGMKIFYILLTVGMFVFAIVLFDISKDQPLFLLFPLVLIAGAVLIIINVLKRKVIIYDDSIVCINLFSTKEISFSDIKGCRIGDKYISIEPVSQQTPKISITNYSDFGDSSQLKSWFSDNFTDLDAADLKFDEEKLMHDPTLGATEEDRKHALKRAKQFAGAYNIIGPVISFVTLLLLNNISALCIIGLIYPLLAVLLMKFSRGLIKFIGNSKRSASSFIMIGFMMPALFTVGISLNLYQIFQFGNLWILMIIVTSAVAFLLYSTGYDKAGSGVKGQLIFMFFMSAIYGAGSVISINCAFDNSAPEIFTAKVIDHRIESGKHTSYMLTLSEWGPMQKEKEEDVGRRLYDKVSIGDAVHVYFRKGVLNAPWYQVGD